MLLRIAELVFVEVLRSYLMTASEDGASWLGGLRDPIVGRALARLHAQPARAWTLPELAHEAGASRSVLAERFTYFVGHPPMLLNGNNPATVVVPGLDRYIYPAGLRT